MPRSAASSPGPFRADGSDGRDSAFPSDGTACFLRLDAFPGICPNDQEFRRRRAEDDMSIAKQPDAGITGLRKFSSPTRAFKLAKFHLPNHLADGKHWAFATDAKEFAVTVAIEQPHA